MSLSREERYVRTMTIRRGGRILAYLFLAAAGGLATFGPPTLIEDQVEGWVVMAWSISLIISSISCLYGAVSDRWIGEFSGLPLLYTVLGFFGIVLFTAARETGNVPLYAYSFTILALASKLYARWQDVRLVKHQAVALGTTDRGA